jgi:hypothetical protein
MLAMPPAVVVTTDEYEDWYRSLDALEQAAVINVVTKLRALGYELGAPHSSALEGTDLPLRELRPKQGHSPLRVIYAFDPARQAVLLIGGDKAGDPKFYRRIVVAAERIWREYLTLQ